MSSALPTPEALIRVDSRGLCTVELEAAGGEVLSYSVDLLECSPEGWRACLGVVGDQERRYEVAFSKDSRGRDVPRCDCPDWAHRYAWKRRRNKGADCKHIEAGRALLALTRKINGACLSRRPEKGATMSAAAEPAQAPPTAQEIARALAEPFNPDEVKWKAQAVKGNRCLAVCYVDARVVQDRLDEVIGVMGWQDSYDVQPDGAVVCTLRLRLGSEWISKTDVGGQSEQPDEGDRKKAAFSDALKRAAVKFGIGRYLYRLPAEWCDYDPQKKRIVNPPRLPPLPATARPAARKGASAAGAGCDFTAHVPEPDEAEPTDGADCLRRLTYWDAAGVAEKRWRAGDLMDFVRGRSGRAGKVESWTGPFHDVVMLRRAFNAADRPLCGREIKELQGKMQGKRTDWPRAFTAAGLPPQTPFEDLTRSQAVALWKWLEAQPDRQKSA